MQIFMAIIGLCMMCKSIYSGKLVAKTNLIVKSSTSYILNPEIITEIMYTQKIIHNKHKESYTDNDAEVYFNNNNFIKGKKLITISPGGVKGFYLFGISNYIKSNYNLDNYIFSGASAGAWNSLFMCFKKNPSEMAYNILNTDLNNVKSLNELIYKLKYKILKNYKDSDFDLRRLFIGVSTLNRFSIETNIYSDFDSLEDAINCCIASSHIPFVTGDFRNKYNDVYGYDGGFSKYPYLNISDSTLHITPSLWKNENNNLLQRSRHYVNNLMLRKINILQMYDDGYNDARINKLFLDKLFLDNSTDY